MDTLDKLSEALLDFDADFDLDVIGHTVSPLDVVQCHTSMLGSNLLVRVSSQLGKSWIAGFRIPDSAGRSALTSIVPLGRSLSFCIILKGETTIVRVDPPAVIEKMFDPISSMLKFDQSVIVASNQFVYRLESDGVSWKSVRVALDGVRLVSFKHGDVLGWSDPDSSEARPFRLRLRDGKKLNKNGKEF